LSVRASVVAVVPTVMVTGAAPVAVIDMDVSLYSPSSRSRGRLCVFGCCGTGRKMDARRRDARAANGLVADHASPLGHRRL
jgi:hypothetical protein